MRKIAIVGVDGSGKTVLMTALGDKYENPDGFGLFLSPENSDAFGYVKLQMDRMRHGIWPSATIAGKSNILEWGLYRKVNGGNTRLCDLSFLDFSGEVYRLAFGSKSDHDAVQYDDVEIGESINELRQHIKDADTLAVLINLKDIISGNVGNPRTREAMWLSKSILDYATRELHVPNVAMVFTQADAYRATIAECGGVRGAYEKYLPHVSNIYPDMRLLAVSAVNMTLPDENGIPCPVDGFQSEGLEDLMEWIVSTVPGCETLISDIKTAPLRCREEAWALREEYIAALAGDAKHRGEILDWLEGKLVEMDSAMRAYPQALPQGALDLLRDELQDIGNFEIAYTQLYSEVPSMADEQILQGVDELCRGSSFAGKVRQEVNEALFAVRKNAAVAMTKARRNFYVFVGLTVSIVCTIALSVFGYNMFLKYKAEQQRIEKQRRVEQQREEARLAKQKAEQEISAARHDMKRAFLDGRYSKVIPLAEKILARQTDDEATLFEAKAVHMLEIRWRSLNGVFDLGYGETIKVLPCEPGSFVMGSTSFEREKFDCATWKEPRHTVKLTKKFWLGQIEVTQGQYEALMGNNPSTNITIGAKYPVNGVSWDDAMAFCRKLAERNADRLPYGYEISLPTEAQWEYAARAGTTTAFWWGDQERHSVYEDHTRYWCDNFYGKGTQGSWYGYGGYESSSIWEAGSGKANPWGFFDMLSNLSEWCYDAYYDSLPDATDPVYTSGAWKVTRGGNTSFDRNGYRRAAFRKSVRKTDDFWDVSDSDEKRYCIGFRIAVVPKRD